MANDRLGALEALISSTRETRDRQIGDLSIDIARNEKDLVAIAHRVAAIESIKPPTVLSYWGPALATLGLVGAVGGSFLTMVQREQNAQYDVIAAKIRADSDKIDILRGDSRLLDSQLRIQDRDLRGALSAVEARQQMLEKQMDAIDFRGSRKWTGKD